MIQHMLEAGLFGMLGFALWNVTKIIVTAMICKHPELSNAKVKYITNIIRKVK